MKAYNAELYLAATAIVSVVLETLLTLTIIRTLGDAFIPQARNKFAPVMAELFMKEGIIDQRLQQRINSFNHIRRAAAHSKSGIMNSWDAEQGISLIKILVDSLF